MTISKDAIASQLERLRWHSDKTFAITSDILLDLFNDEYGVPQDGCDELYELVLQAEEGLQVVCRRIDEAAGIASREARR
jgi:hypothetical protein